MAAQVLAGRRHRNAVASVILLSDGKDRSVRPDIKPADVRGKSNRSYADLVPPSFPTRAGGGGRPAPIHTFGFGASHDAAAMHAVAEATGGTFYFVENHSAIQDSFARCVGGLLSVAVQEARVAVACLHRGVRVQQVKSGCYASHVAADGRAASIDVGELYDDEGRRFLVLVYVPRARTTEEVTRLVKVSCTYRVTATGQPAHVAAPAAVIQRPLELTCAPAPSMDVKRERVRVAATEDIAAARVKADGGEHAGAARILDSRLRAVERSGPAARRRRPNVRGAQGGAARPERPRRRPEGVQADGARVPAGRHELARAAARVGGGAEVDGDVGEQDDEGVPDSEDGGDLAGEQEAWQRPADRRRIEAGQTDHGRTK
jgi:hypothetical protein